jgi:acyl carrier protein phosphodiesterase
MNFLAHAYLSFGNDDLIIGNMISDFVKGKKRYDFPLPVQNGIELHRRIDAFTDAHAITSTAKKYFKPAVGLYAGAFMDVAYDHFLAIDTKQFNNDELHSFSKNIYKVLTNNKNILPERFQVILPYMIQHDWLFNYSTTWGIERSFEGIVKRATFLADSKPAHHIFIEEYDTLQALYENFFPDLKAYAFDQMQQLLK